nr:uncharacterized protein LOC117682688 [Crassostrea gigas]
MEVSMVVFAIFILCVRPILGSERYDTLDKTTQDLTSYTYVYPNRDSVVTLSRNCTVKPVSEMVRHDIKELLDAGAKLIIFNLNFQNHSGKLPGEDESDIYKPFLWERSTGRHGQGILFLKTGFEILSLSTLTYGTEKMKVELLEDPVGCLLNRTIWEIENGLRHILLNDFQEISPNGSGGSLGDNEHICNMHIKNDEQRAVFYHICCRKYAKGETVCQELVKDFWVQMLLYSIYIMNLLVIMFCPYLIPKPWYQDKYQNLKFELFDCKNEIEILVKKTGKKLGTPVPKNVVDFDSLSSMNSFKKQLKKMDYEKIYSMRLSKIYLDVKRKRLIPPNDVPVGIIKSIYDSFFRCRIRERKSLKSCCHSSIFEPFQKSSLRVTHIKWYHCLKELMLIVSFVLAIVPWIIRIAIFYWYEDNELNDRDKAARDRKLDFHYAYFPGSLISFLTPVHIVFLFCYAVLALDAVLFGILEIFTSEIKRNLELVLRKCFRDMHESSYSKSVGWAVRTMLYPLKKYGVLGLVVVGIYWLFVLPVIVVVLAFYSIPTLNIAIRLLCHLFIVLSPKFKFVTTLKEKIGFQSILRIETVTRLPGKQKHLFRFVQFIVNLLSLLALLSCVLLVVEVIVFFVEIMVYTLIGIILNASQTLKYVSLLFMLTLYARDCFGGVTKKYQAFNDAINKAILAKVKKDVDKVAWRTADEQPHTAFQVSVDDHGNESTPKNPYLCLSNGVLKWNIPQLLLFLDNNDTPYIPRTFFFKAAYMDHVGCPGSLYKNLIRAMRQFVTIILFLLFVVVVVMAFGNEYSVSGVNQMLATLAGGFLPWIFRNVLFKPPADIEIDTSSLGFQNMFDDVIKNHKQNWPVTDFHAYNEPLERNEKTYLKSFSPQMDPGSVSMLNDEKKINLLIINMSNRKRHHLDCTFF